jgi:hypothetical protein
VQNLQHMHAIISNSRTTQAHSELALQSVEWTPNKENGQHIMYIEDKMDILRIRLVLHCIVVPNGRARERKVIYKMAS